jgi:cyanophycinase
MIPKGRLLIIGGAEEKGSNEEKDRKKSKQFEHFEILKEIIPTGSRKKIEIITTASDVPEEMNRTYRNAFEKLGYKNIGFIKIETKEEARDPKFVERINRSAGVLFSGGDQFKLMSIIGGTDTIKAIKKKFYEDKNFVIAGTSAGAMVMSKIMIYEGGSNEVLVKDDLKITAGLGLFDTLIIDTHFISRGRFSRLAHAIMMNPEALGVGLGEDTALLIKNGSEAECLGSGLVVIIDGNEIKQTNITEAETDDAIYAENFKVHVLVKGCKFLIKERRLADPPVSGKKNKKAA